MEGQGQNSCKKSSVCKLRFLYIQSRVILLSVRSNLCEFLITVYLGFGVIFWRDASNSSIVSHSFNTTMFTQNVYIVLNTVTLLVVILISIDNMKFNIYLCILSFKHYT